MSQESWTTTALPILEHVLRSETSNPDAATTAALELSTEDKAFHFALAALIEDGYLAGAGVFWPLGRGEPVISVDFLRLTPKGRRAVGDWPSGELGDVLIRVLEAKLMELPEGETNSKFEASLQVGQQVGIAAPARSAGLDPKSAAGFRRGADQPAIRRSPRRSRSDVPAHMPARSSSASAGVRHSDGTGQLEQSRCARAALSPSRGKKVDVGSSRQPANAI